MVTASDTIASTVDDAIDVDSVNGESVVGLGAGNVVVVVVVLRAVVVVVELGKVELIVVAAVELTYFLSLRIMVVLSMSFAVDGDSCVVDESRAKYDAERETAFEMARPVAFTALERRFSFVSSRTRKLIGSYSIGPE